MRLALVADVHIGNHKKFGGELKAGINRRCRLVLDSLEASLHIAQEEQCDAFIINGDLFDVSKPAPQIIAAVQDILQQDSMRKYILLGNHEMESVAVGDNALGPLRHCATIIEAPSKYLISKVVGSFVDAVELWAVPYRPGAAVDWLPSVMAEVQAAPAPGSPASPVRVLALHLGLQDGETPPWLQGAHDSIPVSDVQQEMVKHGIKATYAGNWHDHKQSQFHDTEAGRECYIVQIGTLCPTGWDNPGLQYGTMAIFDSQKPKLNKIMRVPGPRFVSTEADAKTALGEGCFPFLRLRGDPDKYDKLQAKVEKWEKLNVSVEIDMDVGEAQAALRTAAGVARSAETADEAVAAYVKEMPLNNPDLRPLVLEKVKHFLAGAGE